MTGTGGSGRTHGAIQEGGEAKKVVSTFCDSRVRSVPQPRLAAAAAAAAARRRKMAQRRGRATSRFTEEIRTYARTASSPSVWLCLCLVLFPRAAEAGLYTPSDQIVLLTPGNVESFLVNSTAAMVVEFYASWCGHCIAFSPVYKKLARDIKGLYGPAASHVAAAVCTGK